MDAADIVALADRFFAAIEQGDLDTVAAIYAPSCVVWHNFSRAEQPRDANLAVLGWLCRHVGEVRYDEVRRVVIDDGFVQQHVLRGRAPNGEELEVPAMMRVYVAGGRITRVEEYLDTAQVAALRGA